jgi:hypothetical protein
MSKRYEPEIGQACFGNAYGEFDAGDLGDACVTLILYEIERVFWNTRQKQWDRFDDPGIEGIEYHSYYWGDDEEEAAKPNLAGFGLEVRWYKHPGRGMTTNIEIEANGWSDWLDAMLTAIRAADVRIP